MEHYITLFNRTYLPQGLALIRSLSAVTNQYVLWVVCMDDTTFSVLSQLCGDEIRPLRLEDVETDELKRVKSDRTLGEYCWTLTPFLPQQVFTRDPSAKRVTYLDADLFFVDDPRLILSEFNDSPASVLITEHAFAPNYDDSPAVGKYCVQFVSFERKGSEALLSRWQSQCLHWCYNRVEVDRFGDQKYLDDWPRVFPQEVHVLKQRGMAQGPWNASRFPHSEAVFYHMMGVRIYSRHRVSLGHYPIPRPTMQWLYGRYMIELRKSVTQLTERGLEIELQAPKPNFDDFIRMPLRWVKRSWMSNRSNQRLNF